MGMHVYVCVCGYVCVGGVACCVSGDEEAL